MHEVEDLIDLLKRNHFAISDDGVIIRAMKIEDGHKAYMTIHKQKRTVRTHGMTIPVHDYLRGMMRK